MFKSGAVRKGIDLQTTRYSLINFLKRVFQSKYPTLRASSFVTAPLSATALLVWYFYSTSILGVGDLFSGHSRCREVAAEGRLK